MWYGHTKQTSKVIIGMPSGRTELFIFHIKPYTHSKHLLIIQK